MVDGVQYETHQEAAIAKKLVKTDAMWISCMKEAHETETYIPLLRKLFVSILTQCEVGNHKKLYEATKEYLNEDFLRHYKLHFEKNQLDEEFEDGWTLNDFATNSCLIHLEMLLESEGLSLEDLNLPLANHDKEELIQSHLLEKIIEDESELSPEQARR